MECKGCVFVLFVSCDVWVLFFSIGIRPYGKCRKVDMLCRLATRTLEGSGVGYDGVCDENGGHVIFEDAKEDGGG